MNDTESVRPSQPPQGGSVIAGVQSTSKSTEIVRSIQIEDKTIIVHIHLTEDEVRRLLLPHIVGAFADEMRRSVVRWYTINSDSTVER